MTDRGNWSLAAWISSLTDEIKPVCVYSMPAHSPSLRLRRKPKEVMILKYLFGLISCSQAMVIMHWTLLEAVLLE